MLMACGSEGEPFDESRESARSNAENVFDVRRSLAVTDVAILQRFSLERVMDQLARDARVRGLRGIDLFRQWWATQNVGGDDAGPHCDDQVDANGITLLNSFPYDCRPPPSEGAQAACESFADPACAYIPIGLFNRFDAAPEDGSHCGEHRIIYAKRTGQDDRFDRNIVIFEPVVPNPKPRLGLQGCRRLVEEWAELSGIDSSEERAARLERMYFKGVPSFAPVISFDHFGENERSLGQIRTNQFMIRSAPFIWTLREFKLARSCPTRSSCRAEFLPVTDKNNPIALLFGDPADLRARDFQQQLVRDNVSSLAATTLTDISMVTPPAFNSAQSHSSGSSELDYQAALATQRQGVRLDLYWELGKLGSSLTPEQLVERARTQTCAGCHQLSNDKELGEGLFWPASLGFVHVSEVAPELVDGSLRYRISPLLTNSFLPLRARVMFDYLEQRPWRRRGRWGSSVGGRYTH
jgi:hypothetical protein